MVAGDAGGEVVGRVAEPKRPIDYKVIIRTLSIRKRTRSFFDVLLIEVKRSFLGCLCRTLFDDGVDVGKVVT